MSHVFIARAAAPLIEIIRNIKPNELDAQTPCTEYDVRKLINHLLFWGPSLEGAARKETVPPPAEAESELDLTDGWAAKLETQIERMVTAWSAPAAWDGVTRMGGPMELPASLIGGMVVTELAVHGWDLARATGQRPTWDDELVEYVHQELVKTAAQGREMGVYGPEVAVSPSASTLDRAICLTGRDPAWSR